MARMARSWVFVSTLKGRMRQSELAIGHVRNYGSVELRQKCEVSGSTRRCTALCRSGCREGLPPTPPAQ
jgi:hypothetical protein